QSFYAISLDFNETLGRTELWIEGNKEAPTMQGRGTRGGPGQRGGRGGPVPLTGRKKEETLNEKAQVFIAWQKAKDKYNDKLEEVRQTLIPEDKYSKYPFNFEDFRVISENMA